MEIDNTIAKAAVQWDLQVKNIRRDIIIPGSPERCELRFVIECNNNRLYLLENVFAADVDHKSKIIACLDFLFRKGLTEITPYLCSKRNEYMVSCDDRLWQLVPFVSGENLVRPEYVFDKWRGKVMAKFLIELRNKSVDFPSFISRAPFSITDYICKLISQIKTNEPAVLNTIGSVIRFLEKRFMKVHGKLPVAFCHGDFHPLNIIWSKDSIRAVIDWEFLGIKPEIYDAANLIGCIGIEDPQGLLGDLAKDFIGNLKKAELISEISWEAFIEFVIAVRFAWLSEWLRHKDREMIELETVYMNLLADNSNMLKNVWGI
ncbi:MAG: phosphotransferase [Proteobacteria bacterium]|nr:phosphotransferase [Pseudomonadota bacterium]